MKRKVLAMCFALSLALNVQAVVDASLKEAYIKGADAKIIYRVVDDGGLPVEGATADGEAPPTEQSFLRPCLWQRECNSLHHGQT